MEIQLTTPALEYLLSEKETIDFRLDEERWKHLQPGDEITFWEDFSGWDKSPSANARYANVIIMDILRANSFSELIDTISESFCRCSSKEETLEDLRKWWTQEVEKTTGVLGMRVRLR